MRSMAADPCIVEVRDLTKRYGDKLVLDRLSFTVQPGVVTGFLGPNGAGKSTTMRLIVGLDRPTHGGATIGGRPYSALTDPLRTVGALLDAGSTHPGRSAYTTCATSPRHRACPAGASTRSSNWSASPPSLMTGPAGSRSVWGSVSDWRQRCSATLVC